ncbi:MAG: hypothetical protein ACTSXL_00240 [Alphaproteobacteria bacterium]
MVKLNNNRANFKKIFERFSIGFSGTGYDPFLLKLLKSNKNNLKVVLRKTTSHLIMADLNITISFYFYYNELR